MTSPSSTDSANDTTITTAISGQYQEGYQPRMRCTVSVHTDEMALKFKTTGSGIVLLVMSGDSAKM